MDKMRRAYIGFSSPIFYDYANPAELAYENQYSSPNPILDGPLGLLLFFDELWFLTRALCPQNMRGLQYVHFVDEKRSLDGFAFDAGIDTADVFGADEIKYYRDGFNAYEETLKARGVSWWGPRARIDNHSHHIQSPYLEQPWQLVGNSMDPSRVLFDLAVVNHLGSSFEYITNTFTDRLLSGSPSAQDHSLSDFQAGEQMLLISDIPNYQTSTGPYHPCIDDLRVHGCLPHFREWVSESAKGRSTVEIADVRREIEATISEQVRVTMAKYYDPNQEVKSLAKTFLGWGIDAVTFSGAEKLWNMWEARSEHRKKEGIRWQGFILAAQQALRAQRR